MNDWSIVRNSGVVDSKSSYLDSMRKGHTIYELIEHTNDSVRIHGCVAILTGLVQIRCANCTKASQFAASLSQHLAQKPGQGEVDFLASNQGTLMTFN